MLLSWGEFERAEVALQNIPQLCPDIAFADKMSDYPKVKEIIVTSHRKEYLSFHNTKKFKVIGNSGMY
jgi:hypothetical protein